MISDVRLRLKSSRMPVLLGISLIIMLSANPAPAGKLNAKQVLERSSRHYELIKDYSVDAVIAYDSPVMHVPEMKVKIYYKKPDKLNVESKDGLALLPRKGVVAGNPLKDLLACTDLSIEKSERLSGLDCYVIKGTLTQDEREIQTLVWIDKKQWLVRKMAANPSNGPSVNVDLKYKRFDNRYWLPVSTKAKISLPPMPGGNKDAKPGKPTVVTAEFSNYRINTNLNDKIFRKHGGSD